VVSPGLPTLPLAQHGRHRSDRRRSFSHGIAGIAAIVQSSNRNSSPTHGRRGSDVTNRSGKDGRHGDGRLPTVGRGRHGRNGARGLVLLCRQRVAGFDPAASASAIHGRHGSLSHAQARQARNGSPNGVTTMAPHGEAGIAPQGSAPRSKTRQATHPTGRQAAHGHGRHRRAITGCSTQGRHGTAPQRSSRPRWRRRSRLSLHGTARQPSQVKL
jgi:hypothetical protein